QDLAERVPVERERHRSADFRFVERRSASVDDQVVGDARRRIFADRLGRLRLHIPPERNGDVGRKGYVEIPGGEGEDTGRTVLDDLELDAVEVRLTLLPV